MLSSPARSRLYLGFYELYVPACRRFKSTSSAIKHGLRAETSSPFDRRRSETSRKPWQDKSRDAKPNFSSRSRRSSDNFNGENDARPNRSPGSRKFDKFSTRRPQQNGRGDRFSSNRTPKRNDRSGTYDQRDALSSSDRKGRFDNNSNGNRQDRVGQSNAFDRQPKKEGWRDRKDNKSVGMKSQTDEEDRVPISIPYTTAASVFLYGVNPILAALRGKRRKPYSLFLTSRALNNPSVTEIFQAAKAAGIKIQQDAAPWLLDQMTAAGTQEGESRPHNGVVLEASKLPAPPVLALGAPDKERSIVRLTLDSQSVEEAAINGNLSTLQFPPHRQPFVLFVDGITDPGNLGNILRTAHFYSVDAVAVATNTCAPLTSAVLAKASAGACEAVPIIALPKPANFIYDSRSLGWKIFAAAPSPDEFEEASDVNPRQLTTASLKDRKPLLEQPCILMLGAEGEGLRSNLTAKADFFMGIEQAPRASGSIDVGVESLNVSVAAGVLIEAFMRETESARVQANLQREEEKLF